MPGAVIEKSVEALFALYREHPLRLMREIGIQARLANLIQGALDRPFCNASVEMRSGEVYLTEDTVERVQMEIRVKVPGHSGLETSDIVVLRQKDGESVSLQFYSEGHLDIVSKISARDVAAVIEVKAACSADLRERHKFRCDVDKLLKLAALAADSAVMVPQLHFVLVDKSLSAPGHDRSNKQPRRDWFSELEIEVAGWTLPRQERFWAKSPRIRMLPEEPADHPFVHVWTLEQAEDGSAGSLMIHQYAVAA